MEWLQNFSAWAQAHYELALAVVFLASFLDCLFVIGLIFISAPFLFGAGALVATGAFDFWPTVLVIAGGGGLADTVSYFIGRHYGAALFNHRYFARHTELAQRGRNFFARHGGKGLILAHNIGVLRPLLPAVTGAYGLSPLRYMLAIIPAALIWAMLCVAIGMLFGASMGLAAEVTKRLAILILGLGGLLWLTFWLSRHVARWAQAHTESWLGAMLDLSRQHRILGKLGPALADTDQPETPVLGLVAVALLVLATTVLLMIWGVTAHGPAPGADLAVYQALRSLENPWGTHLAVFFSLLGEWPVYLPYALSVLALLAWKRHRHAAAHWLAALLFALTITLGLSLIPSISNPLEYSGLISNAHFPRDLVMATVIYGFTPVLLLSGPVKVRTATPYTVMLILLMLIVLARLYLGSLWLSVGLAATFTGLLWVAALGLGYRRHGPENIALPRFAPALVVLAVAALWHQQVHFNTRLNEHHAAPISKPMDAQLWWTQSWTELHARRLDMAGHDKQFLNLQWAGDLAQIRATLIASGWQESQPLDPVSALSWLSSETPIAELPLLPRYHAGEHEVLRLRRNGHHADHQFLLRLWPSGFVLSNGQPLWLGTLVQQEALPVFKVFRYPTNENIYTVALDSLQLPLPGYESRKTRRNGHTFTTLLLRPTTETAVSPQTSPE